MADQTQSTPLAGDKLHLGYNPYAASNYDSGGFGFGGTSGSGGGWGIGGNGPQTGAYGSQTNYGQGLPAGDPDTHHADKETLPEAHKPTWTDSFPHSFHGWGPQTPDPDDHEAEHIRERLADELTLKDGRMDEADHIVWRYAGREQRA